MNLTLDTPMTDSTTSNPTTEKLVQPVHTTNNTIRPEDAISERLTATLRGYARIGHMPDSNVMELMYIPTAEVRDLRCGWLNLIDCGAWGKVPISVHNIRVLDRWTLVIEYHILTKFV